jgi:hypothetical protein
MSRESYALVVAPGANPHIFTSVVRLVQRLLQAQGHACDVVPFGAPFPARGEYTRRVVFGGGMERITPIEEQLRPNDVVFNLEQLYDGCMHVSEAYVRQMERCHVWDYAECNREWLMDRHDIVVERLLHIGHAPELAVPRTLPKVRPIDVLFYGWLRPRRTSVLQQLRDKGLNVVAMEQVYDDALYDLMRRSKLVLNIHMHPSAVLEVLRVVPAVMLGVPVLSEPSTSPSLIYPWKHVLHMAPYEQLADRVMVLLQHYEMTVRFSNEGQRRLASMPSHFDDAVPKSYGR